MKVFPRYNMALVLTLIYAVIIMVQLLPAAVQSAYLARQCGGDCTVCGCSPEQIAKKSCCCLKKMHAEKENDHDSTAECCKKKSTAHAPVLSCGSRCRDNSPQEIWDADEIALPAGSSWKIACNFRDDQYLNRVDRLSTRHLIPPDPPPKSSSSPLSLFG